MHMPLKRKYMYIYYTILCHVMPCYASCLLLRYIILSILSSWVEWFHICLSHWGRVTHICVNKVTIIGSDNGLSPGRRQAIIWTNAGLLLIGPLETNFTETLINIQTFSFRKMHLKMSPGKWRPFCLGLNVLKRDSIQNTHQVDRMVDICQMTCANAFMRYHFVFQFMSERVVPEVSVTYDSALVQVTV